MKTHEENIKIYLENGGDSKIANRYRLSTTQNRAKISYFISQQSVKFSNKQLSNTTSETEFNDTKIEEKKEEKPSKPTFLGFISQYPTSLHSAYQSCYKSWLDVCSMKIQLNEISPLNQEEAYEIQLKIFKSISTFDHNKKALDYWRENKRILPTESKKDYSNFTSLELDQERRNLASLISRRRQTIIKKENELPDISDSNYNKKNAALQMKKEQLEELILNEKRIIEILKVESN